MRLSSAILALIATLSLAGQARSQTPPLPALGADPGKVTVSGLSSGGYMAMQYAVVFSASVKGVGVVAGGPFFCAGNYGLPIPFTAVYPFFEPCMHGKPNGRTSLTQAALFAKDKAIDPVGNIAAQRVYLFHGTADSVLATGVMDAVEAFYRAAKVPDANLVYISKDVAGHAFLAPQGGNPCGANATPYVETCSIDGSVYDQPGAILQQVYGPAPLISPATTLSARPRAFDQRPFLALGARMAPTGHLYVPAACRTAGSACAVHVVFHGCEQSDDNPTVKNAVYAKAGYNRWADANRIIILYPQVGKTVGFNGLPNLKGCWDWWSYTDPAFATREGAQLKSVQAMVARLTAAR